MNCSNNKYPKYSDNKIDQSYYSLQNKNNYNENLKSNIEDIIGKYSKLVFDYLFFIFENIGEKNKNYINFIIERGLTTITHVFTILLVYSNNLDLSYYHSQKSFYFYVEFIEQISEDQHSFLKLSSRDASIFVYKKTIFEVPNEFIKKTELTNQCSIKLQTLETFDLYKYITLLLTKKILNLSNFKSFNIENNKLYLVEYFKNIEKMNEKIIHSNINKQDLKNIIYFITQLENIKKCNQSMIYTNVNNVNNNIDNVNIFFNILLQFVKKYLKIKEKNISIEHKIYSNNLFEKLEENKDCPNKFIEILLE